MQSENSRKKDFQDILRSPAAAIIAMLAAIALICVVFNIITKGGFLDGSNFKVILSHTIYPTFIAWALCFLFACGYTDMSIGAVVVLGSFGACVFGNWYGYPGVIIGGLVIGAILIFLNFSIFAFSKIPSWIAGISLAMVYEAVAGFLKFSRTIKPLIDTDLDNHTRALGQMPLSIIILAAALVVVYFIYNRTTVGLNIRALGGNKDVSKALGVNTNRTLLWVGLICGILIGAACVIQESYAGQTTVKTGLTSMNMIFQPLAIVLLAQILQKRINIIIAVPICSFIIYAVFNLLTMFGVPSGTLQEACLGAFLILFGILGQKDVKGVVK